MESRIQALRQLFGKTVSVCVDRPIGYEHHGIRYPVNYGYIPHLMGGDGEPQDAYILGVTEPLTVFQGVVIGMIHRMDDCEDKLIVAPPGVRFHQAEIAQQVSFQEQFFQSRVISLYQKACGVIPFRKSSQGTQFLVLLQTNGCWSFPKGHAEAGESEQQTALRELREETGLSAQLFGTHRIRSEYTFVPTTVKEVILFPAEVDGRILTQPEEIRSFRWVCAQELAELLHPDTYQACRDLLLQL